MPETIMAILIDVIGAACASAHQRCPSPLKWHAHQESRR